MSGRNKRNDAYTLFSFHVRGGKEGQLLRLPTVRPAEVPLSVANHVTATITSISDGSRIVSNAPAAEPATMAL